MCRAVVGRDGKYVYLLLIWPYRGVCPMSFNKSKQERKVKCGIRAGKKNKWQSKMKQTTPHRVIHRTNYSIIIRVNKRNPIRKSDVDKYSKNRFIKWKRQVFSFCSCFFLYWCTCTVTSAMKCASWLLWISSFCASESESVLTNQTSRFFLPRIHRGNNNKKKHQRIIECKLESGRVCLFTASPIQRTYERLDANKNKKNHRFV